MSGLPNTMSAAVYQSPGVVVVEERPVPAPGPDQVLVEVAHCGICGSDIHMLLEGWGNKPGMIAGHEFTGTVAAVGSDVSGWSVGEDVVVGPSPRCGTCRRCNEGKPSQCENRGGSITDGGDGAFAHYALVSAGSVLRIPPGLSAREAALAEPLAVALHGITRSGIAPGDTAMIIGAGPIGALTLAALVAKGIGPVSVVEPGERRRALARELGAAEVLDPAELETFPLWEPERIASRAVHVVLECSGKKAAIETAFQQLRRGGTLVMVGAGVQPPSFDPNRMILNELHVCGSFVYDADGFERALELLASGAMPNRVLIEPDDVPLGGIPRALEDLAAGRQRGEGHGDPTAAAWRGRLMPHPFYPSGTPRFNHVAMSVPAELLGGQNRADITRFWSTVLGFDEIEMMTVDRKRLILSCVHWDQFIFLIAEDDPMLCPWMDHFGLAVGSHDELVGVQSRAETFRETDDRVDLIDLHVDDQGPVKIHSLYVKYLLPMMCELQWWEFTGAPIGAPASGDKTAAATA